MNQNNLPPRRTVGRQVTRASFSDKWEDDFDKNFNRMSKAIITMWVVGGIATLAFWIVVVWAIIKLVNHFA